MKLRFPLWAKIAVLSLVMALVGYLIIKPTIHLLCIVIQKHEVVDLKDELSSKASEIEEAISRQKIDLFKMSAQISACNNSQEIVDILEEASELSKADGNPITNTTEENRYLGFVIVDDTNKAIAKQGFKARLDDNLKLIPLADSALDSLKIPELQDLIKLSNDTERSLTIPSNTYGSLFISKIRSELFDNEQRLTLWMGCDCNLPAATGQERTKGTIWLCLNFQRWVRSYGENARCVPFIVHDNQLLLDPTQAKLGNIEQKQFSTLVNDSTITKDERNRIDSFEDYDNNLAEYDDFTVTGLEHTTIFDGYLNGWKSNGVPLAKSLDKSALILFLNTEVVNSLVRDEQEFQKWLDSAELKQELTRRGIKDPDLKANRLDWKVVYANQLVQNEIKELRLNQIAKNYPVPKNNTDDRYYVPLSPSIALNDELPPISKTNVDLNPRRIVIGGDSNLVNELQAKLVKKYPGIQLQAVKYQNYALYGKRIFLKPGGRSGALGFVSAMSYDELNSDISREINPIWWGYLLSSLVSIAVALRLAQLLARPLKDTITAMSVTRTGNYKNKLPANRRDEIGDLIREFNAMTDSLATSDKEITLLNADLQNANRDLNQRVEEQTAELKKKLAELQRQKRLREEFLQQVNHDIRGPLFAIAGQAELLVSTNLTEAQSKRVEKIRSAAARLNRMVEDMRLYQRFTDGQDKPEYSLFALQDIFDEIRSDVEQRVRDNHIDLKLEISPEIPQLVSARPWLERIVGNLLSNACKFTKNATVCCRAFLDRSSSIPMIVIEVQDQGRGLTPAEQLKLFKPFEKIISREENPDGTGLGLVISRGFCEALGGTLQIDPSRTEKGTGATFVVRLPLQTQLPQENSPVIRGRSALVIDDDDDACQLLSHFLEQHSFVVSVAKDGESGLAMAREQKPHFILLDVQLPKLDGWRVLKELKEHEDTASIPVVMVSVLNQSQRGYTLGADDYLNKPINWVYFKDVLRRLHPNLKNGTILVVDDDKTHRETIVDKLKEQSWQTLEAGHGAEALQVLEYATPDLILLDLLMPVLDGFEFLKRMRRCEAWQHIPVIVLTGKHLTESEKEQFSGMVDEVLEKSLSNWDSVKLRIEEIIAAHAVGDTNQPGGDPKNA